MSKDDSLAHVEGVSGIRLAIHPDFEVVILRDAPEPPVQVRRDLLEMLRSSPHRIHEKHVNQMAMHDYEGACPVCAFLEVVDVDNAEDTP